MSTSRDETPFHWYVTCGMPVYAELAGVRFDRIFREADAIIDAFAVGEPRARALFGPEVTYAGPGWAGISYGHVSCLGAPLHFPQDSEVAHTPIYGSLREGIEALEQPVDWAEAGMMPFYLDLWEAVRRAFPEKDIPFAGFGYEGPLTTAWELRGHDFFLDIYDDPDRCKAFLRRLTDSITEYAIFVRRLNGESARAQRVGLYDDIASLIHPRLWPEFVLPYAEQYFQNQTSGERYAHIENLVPEHLPYLDLLALDSFDPSVVTKLTPADVRDHCQVPFYWRLTPMQMRDLSCEEIRRFVFASVADGASGIFCNVLRGMTTPADARKVRSFIDAAKDCANRAANNEPLAPTQPRRS